MGFPNEKPPAGAAGVAVGFPKEKVEGAAGVAPKENPPAAGVVGAPNENPPAAGAGVADGCPKTGVEAGVAVWGVAPKEKPEAAGEFGGPKREGVPNPD